MVALKKLEALLKQRDLIDRLNTRMAKPVAAPSLVIARAPELATAPMALLTPPPANMSMGFTHPRAPSKQSNSSFHSVSSHNEPMASRESFRSPSPAMEPTRRRARSETPVISEGTVTLRRIIGKRPRPAPKAAAKAGPKAVPKAAPRAAPRAEPKAVPKAVPRAVRRRRIESF
jgi:hypothetical protein